MRLSGSGRAPLRAARARGSQRRQLQSGQHRVVRSRVHEEVRDEHRSRAPLYGRVRNARRGRRERDWPGGSMTATFKEFVRRTRAHSTDRRICALHPHRRRDSSAATDGARRRWSGNEHMRVLAGPPDRRDRDTGGCLSRSWFYQHGHRRRIRVGCSPGGTARAYRPRGHRVISTDRCSRPRKTRAGRRPRARRKLLQIAKP